MKIDMEEENEELDLTNLIEHHYRPLSLSHHRQLDCSLLNCAIHTSFMTSDHSLGIGPRRHLY